MPLVLGFRILKLFSFSFLFYMLLHKSTFCFSIFLLLNTTKYGHRTLNVSFYGHKTTPSFWVLLFVALNLVFGCIWPSENAFISTPLIEGFHFKCFFSLNSVRLTFRSSQNDIPFISKCYLQLYYWQNSKLFST